MDTFQTRWVHARQLEETGEIEAAVHAYEQILAMEPERLYARIRLCGLQQHLGHYRPAYAQAMQAIDAVRDGKRPADLHHVTRQLLVFNEHEQIKNLILGADWDRVEILGTSPVLIQHLWLSGQVEQALTLCERVLQIAPRHAALNYSHGILLNYVGRQGDAAQAFGCCLASAPLHAGAHWSLAYLCRSLQPGIRVPAIEAALASRQRRNDVDSAIYLHYALFKEHNDAGHTAAAWTHLETGAKLKRETLTYDAGREASAVRALLEYPVAPAVRGSSAEKSAPRVFVVGMPRTGTTVIDRILGNHPLVTASGELGEFRAALSWWLDRFIGPELDDSVIEQAVGLPMREVGQRYRDAVAWRMQPDRPVLLDKNPENFLLSAFIAEALDDARIICIRRRPMDACFSNLKELFANDSYGYSYRQDELAEHYHAFDRLARHWQASMPDRFTIVDYEKLVTSPVEMSAQLFEFSGLSFDPEYVDITRNQSVAATASAAQIRRPIDTSNIDAWKVYAEQLDPLKTRLEALGYDID